MSYRNPQCRTEASGTVWTGGEEIKTAPGGNCITDMDYNNNNIIIARHLSAHLKFSMRLQREAKTLNHLYNLR